MKKWLALTLAAAISAVSLAADQKPAANPAAKGGNPVLLLDRFSVWRTFQAMKPPLIQMDSGPQPLITSTDWLNRETPAAPADWTKPEFVDGAWLRGSALAFVHSPYVARLYLRARFEVTDPAQVQDLKLSLDYYGGAIIRVNGQEVARGHLAPDAGAAALAEAYPAEAFLTDDGKITPPSGWQMNHFQKQLALRKRSLADVAIPTKVLRKGVNVLAIELVRSPYNKIVDEKKIAADSKPAQESGTPYNLSWNTCELQDVKLTAGGADGLVPNVGRPDGLQAWNGDVMASDYDSEIGDRCVPLGPVVIAGAANGWFSGKVVVGSPKAITGLKATVSELNGPATIPASAVRTRYVVAWDEGRTFSFGGATPQGARLMDVLLESPLEVFSPAGSFGTTVPIWVTVKVPADAKPGTYTGQLTITAQGEKPITAPVKLQVADFTLPDAGKQRTWVELIESPDTLALEYNVPLWSDKHWALMDQSWRYLAEIGSRTAYLPLICHTNFGNAESMVRWIKKSDGTYDYDFSILDKYLDLVEKHIGKPAFVVFPVWEVYLSTPPSEVKATEKDAGSEKVRFAARWDLRGKGPAVTALDPTSGQTATVYLPRWEDPAAKPLWKPLFDQLRQRMAKRGLADQMMLGMASDIWPSKDEVAAIQEVSGNLPWASHTHGGSHAGSAMYNLAPLGYTAWVWNVVLPEDPSKGRMYGWKRPDLIVQYLRFQWLNEWPLSAIEHFAELNITGQQRGVGRIGGDVWKVIRDKKGVRQGWPLDRYPESMWHSLNIFSNLLVPGPTGPLASARYEAFRAGSSAPAGRIGRRLSTPWPARWLRKPNCEFLCETA